MRILVADDDATSRLMLEAMVAKQGHECLVAADGSSAWEILTTEGVEVLLTDWMMPGLDGPELCRRVREELIDRYVYVALITGLGQRDQILEGMRAGADDYLVKPVDPFMVETRLIAAKRVTALHRQVALFRSQLELANLELLGQSRTDPLTGLGNRRQMEGDLDSTHAQAERNGRPFALALLDIDHFKQYNDHYGHPAGDQALRRVATCLSTTVRAGDSAYRYGGEEFVLIMPDCPVLDAATVAERVCQGVAHIGLIHSARPTAPSLITISVGVSCWSPESPLGASELLQEADRALYLAKDAGRNRVRIAQDSTSRVR